MQADYGAYEQDLKPIEDMDGEDGFFNGGRSRSQSPENIKATANESHYGSDIVNIQQ